MDKFSVNLLYEGCVAKLRSNLLYKCTVCIFWYETLTKKGLKNRTCKREEKNAYHKFPYKLSKLLFSFLFLYIPQHQNTKRMFSYCHTIYTPSQTIADKINVDILYDRMHIAVIVNVSNDWCRSQWIKSILGSLTFAVIMFLLSGIFRFIFFVFLFLYPSPMCISFVSFFHLNNFLSQFHIGSIANQEGQKRDTGYNFILALIKKKEKKSCLIKKNRVHVNEVFVSIHNLLIWSSNYMDFFY